LHLPGVYFPENMAHFDQKTAKEREATTFILWFLRSQTFFLSLFRTVSSFSSSFKNIVYQNGSVLSINPQN